MIRPADPEMNPTFILFIFATYPVAELYTKSIWLLGRSVAMVPCDEPLDYGGGGWVSADEGTANEEQTTWLERPLHQGVYDKIIRDAASGQRSHTTDDRHGYGSGINNS